MPCRPLLVLGSEGRRPPLRLGLALPHLCDRKDGKRRAHPAVWSYGLTVAQVEGGVEAQAEQALKNMEAAVEAGRSKASKFVKITVRASVLVIVRGP